MQEVQYVRIQYCHVVAYLPVPQSPTYAYYSTEYPQHREGRKPGKAVRLGLPGSADWRSDLLTRVYELPLQYSSWKYYVALYAT